MKIVLVNPDEEYIEIVTLKSEEAKKYRKATAYNGYDFDVVYDILSKRNIYIENFTPYFVCDDGEGIPVFDEKHKEEPLVVL